MRAECQIQPRTAVCRSSLCCRHTISVMPRKARNRYIIMPKQAICRSSTCCRHIYEVKAQSGRNRHIKNIYMPMRPIYQTSLCWRHRILVNRHTINAHAGRMSIQQKAADIRHIKHARAGSVPNCPVSAETSMCGHAHACDAFPLQTVHLVVDSGELG